MKLQQDPVIALQLFVEKEIPSSSSKDHLKMDIIQLLVSSDEDTLNYLQRVNYFWKREEQGN
jgi:hypothetical protein